MSEQLKITYVPTNTLLPADYNPRRMSDRQRRALETSLDTFGFVQPITVNKRNGIVVGGHQRLTAAKALGHDTVPVVYVDLDEEKEKALNVALNKISGDWDYASLVEVLHSIEETSSFDLTGFGIDEFQAIERELNEESKSGREGKVPPPPRDPKSRFGEVYKLGEHTLVVGDSTDPEAYRHTDVPARMMFTDPPYNIAYEGGTAEKLKIENDSFDTEDQYRDFLYAFLKAAWGKNKGVSYICFASNMSEPVYAAWRLADGHSSTEIHQVSDKARKGKQRGKKNDVPSTILWDKDGFTLGRSHYQAGHEPILYGWHKGATNKYWCGDRNQSNVWTYPKPHANREHPTMKPVDLVERAIRNSSLQGDTVLDPFGGSGSTLVAAENIGRKCYTIEMDPRFADVIIERYKSLSGHGEVTRSVSVEDSLPFEDGSWGKTTPAPDPETEES